MDIQGVIHIGMHEMEELKEYHKCGIRNIIWFEADEILCEKYRDLTEEAIFNAVISDKEEIVYFYMMNRSSSNSIFKPKMNIEYRKDIKLDQVVRRQAVPLSNFNISRGYNMLNLDIQGAELKALKGADLAYIDYIYTEVNIAEMYEGIPRIEDIDRYLKDYTRVKTKIHKNRFGDALYIKKHN